MAFLAGALQIGANNTQQNVETITCDELLSHS